MKKGVTKAYSIHSTGWKHLVAHETVFAIHNSIDNPGYITRAVLPILNLQKFHTRCPLADHLRHFYFTDLVYWFDFEAGGWNNIEFSLASGKPNTAVNPCSLTAQRLFCGIVIRVTSNNLRNSLIKFLNLKLNILWC